MKGLKGNIFFFAMFFLAVVVGNCLAFLITDSFWWRNIIGCAFALIIFLVIIWLEGFVNTIKDPDARVSMRLGISAMDYRKFKDLFDKINSCGLNGESDHQDELNYIWKNHRKSWEKYCKSRSGEFKSFYPIGKDIRVQKDGTGEYVRGVFVDYYFDGTWWKYRVEFENAIGFYNSWPEKVQNLSAKFIDGIEKGEIEGSTVRIFFSH